MTSDSQRAANRENAKRSTGPRTKRGKESSKRNSKRHGLGIAIFKDPAWTGRADRLAKAFTPTDAEPGVRERLRIMAGTMLDVLRVEAARTEVWNSSLPGQAGVLAVSEMADLPAQADAAEREAAACLEILSRLVGLTRYERGALSRCKRACAALTSH
jgi:hypothetical protein